MAYDEFLAERIRNSIQKLQINIVEKKMFGGITFLYRGKMSIGIVKDSLMVRVFPEEYEDCLSLPHVRPMDFTGKPMKGWIFVSPEGIDHERDLDQWVERGIIFAKSLV